MNLDVSTLDLVLSIVNLMACILMFVLWRINPTVKGPALWFLSASTSFLSFLFMHFIDGNLGMFLNNCGTLTGAILLMEGVLRFRKLGDARRRLKGIVLLIVLSIVMSYINQSNPTARYLYHDIIVVSVCVISAIAMLYRTSKMQFVVHLYTAISFLIIVPVSSYRWLLAYQGQIEDWLIGTTQHAFQGFLFLSVIPHVVGWAFGLGLALSYQMRQQLKDSMEAKWLQAQIQPHFIFNTLNSINALSVVDVDKMRKLTEEFSHFLRSKFDSQTFNRLISIEEELSITKSYLYIEQIRFGDRLNVEWHVEELAAYYIPTLTIQPIVENAIKHGLMTKDHGGTIAIHAYLKDDNVRIVIQDDGVGMDEATVHSIESNVSEDDSTGIGLVNTNRRLMKEFGTGLEIQSKVGEGTTIALHIPKSIACT